MNESKILNEALCKAGKCPRLVELATHSHMSETFSINTGDTLLAGPIIGLREDYEVTRENPLPRSGEGYFFSARSFAQYSSRFLISRSKPRSTGS